MNQREDFRLRVPPLIGPQGRAANERAGRPRWVRPSDADRGGMEHQPTPRGSIGKAAEPAPSRAAFLAAGRRRDRQTAMNTTASTLASDDRKWAIDQLLATVRNCGSHGHLVDVRDSLRAVLAPDRPLVMLCPHADDGAITAACLMHEYAVRRGLPVIEVLVFAGERNVAAPWLNDAKKITVREGEFRLECNVLGAEGVCWNLECYNRPGYQPTDADIAKVVDWFSKRRPGAVIVPPANDAARGTPGDPGPGRRRDGRGRARRCPGPVRLDPLGPAPAAQRLFHLRRRGGTDQGMGHPLPRLAGAADRLHRVLFAPGPGLCRIDPRVGRGAQPRRAGPPHG